MTGIFFRTLTFLEHDIKPVFVFDGKPPGEKLAVVSVDSGLYQDVRFIDVSRLNK
jgi:hypothetical protein